MRTAPDGERGRRARRLGDRLRAWGAPDRLLPRALRSGTHERPARRLIRAVTFDCWGTLLLDSPASDDRYRRHRLGGIQIVLEKHGVTPTPGQLERAYGASGQWLGRLWERSQDVPVEQHVIALLRALDPRLPDRLSAAAISAMVQAYASPALLAPPAVDQGARGALEALAGSGVALAIVSNTMRTPGVVLREILGGAGLLPLFGAVTFSDECGIRKPAPAIFHQTLREVGVKPEEAVHVGDDVLLDVEGARDAGMGIIQVSPRGRATAPVKPDAVIRRLGELPAALRGLSM